MLNDISSAALRQAGGAFCLAKGVLAINASGATGVKSTTAYTYCIDGITYTKAALSAQALTVNSTIQPNITPNSAKFTTQPVSTTVYYVIGLDASGNVYTVQGTYAGQTFVNTPYIGTGNVPDINVCWGTVPLCPIGMLKVVTDSTHTFLAGSTALDATGVTVTYYDLTQLPATLKPA